MAMSTLSVAGGLPLFRDFSSQRIVLDCGLPSTRETAKGTNPARAGTNRVEAGTNPRAAWDESAARDDRVTKALAWNLSIDHFAKKPDQFAKKPGGADCHAEENTPGSRPVLEPAPLALESR